jgi:hypothetical protein
MGWSRSLREPARWPCRKIFRSFKRCGHLEECRVRHRVEVAPPGASSEQYVNSGEQYVSSAGHFVAARMICIARNFRSSRQEGRGEPD